MASARVTRAGFGVTPKQSFERCATRQGFRAFRKVRDGEHAIAGMRDACATQHAFATPRTIACVTSSLKLNRTMPFKEIDNFLRLLKKSPTGAVFNPWWEVDEENDVGPNAPAIRRKQLSAYLRKRGGKAKLAVIGEALGYRGGHFSGIPMTSERMLLGKMKDSGIQPKQIFSSIKPHRTSKREECRDGFSEPTATIVWGTLLRLGLKSDQFVLWNAFPWHSFDSHRGILSNRTPNQSERAAGLTVLKAFLELFPCDQVVALGKIAAAQLERLGVNAHCVRHPASGGAKLFRQQMAKVAQDVSN